MNRNKIIGFLIVITIFSGSLFYSCSDNPVDPYANLEPGSRNYEWSVMELVETELFKWPEQMLAYSDSCIWLEGRGIIYHYNGSKWRSYSVLTSGCEIFGFSENDIYFTGSGGKLIHFDGKSLQTLQILDSFEDYYDVSYVSIWGSSPRDIYAVGALSQATTYKWGGIISHYNGRVWENIEFPNTDLYYQQVGYASLSSNNLLLLGFNVSIDSAYLYSYNDKKLSAIDSNVIDGRRGLSIFHPIGSEIVILRENKLYAIEEEKYMLLFDVPEFKYTFGFNGRHRKDILYNVDGRFYHYNGTNSELLYDSGFDNYVMISLSVTSNAVYTLAVDMFGNKFTIIKGLLK